MSNKPAVRLPNNTSRAEADAAADAIQPVDGWCYADSRGRLYTATFWDVDSDAGRIECFRLARRALDGKEFNDGRAVPVRLIGREE